MIFGKTGLVAAVLAAGSLAITAPAPAQAHGDDAAIAIGAGVVGLAIGAAIASDDRGRDVYVNYGDRGYYPRYRGGYYAPPPVYRAYPAYPAWRGHEGHYERYDRYRRYRAQQRGDYRGWRGW